ncbi:hypothetical protein MMC08_003482 [Hypocenomyce scalaris]|nr:hypothetical protein [Hypocenomyce scalaris]
MAAQTVLPPKEVSIGNVLDNQLAKRLAGISSITPQQIETTGATGLLDTIPPRYHTAALEAYNDSLRVCFQVALILVCLSILGALGMEWRSVKKNERTAEESKDQGDLSKKKAPVAVAAADGGKDKDRDAAAALSTMSTEATHTASHTGVAHTSTLATVEKDRGKDRD